MCLIRPEDARAVWAGQEELGVETLMVHKADLAARAADLEAGAVIPAVIRVFLEAEDSKRSIDGNGF